MAPIDVKMSQAVEEFPVRSSETLENEAAHPITVTDILKAQSELARASAGAGNDQPVIVITNPTDERNLLEMVKDAYASIIAKGIENYCPTVEVTYSGEKTIAAILSETYEISLTVAGLCHDRHAGDGAEGSGLVPCGSGDLHANAELVIALTGTYSPLAASESIGMACCLQTGRCSLQRPVNKLQLRHPQPRSDRCPLARLCGSRCCQSRRDERCQ